MDGERKEQDEARRPEEGRGRSGPFTEPARLALQVRGILAERVVVSTTLDPFLSIKALATYAGVSVRTLRECLGHPTHPLPHYRIGSKILVRRSEFDAWIVQHRRVAQTDVAGLVNDVLGSISRS
jgi:excisionase family DNA binding protein